MVQGQPRRHLEDVHDIESEFFVGQRTVHERIGSLHGLRQSQQEVSKAASRPAAGEHAGEVEGAIVGNYAFAELANATISPELTNEDSTLPSQAVVISEGPVVDLHAAVT